MGIWVFYPRIENGKAELAERGPFLELRPPCTVADAWRTDDGAKTGFETLAEKGGGF